MARSQSSSTAKPIRRALALAATTNDTGTGVPPLNPVQSRLIEAVLERRAPRLIDFEGAMRLGKSWAAVILAWLLALLHPGIRILLARWKQEDADGQLAEVWHLIAVMFPKRLRPVWVPSISAYRFSNGSIVYRHGLRASSEEEKYSKWRGKTLAVIIIDQGEEVPYWAFADMQARLSQAANPETMQPYEYPLHLILVPNSVDEDHWIATEFPPDNSKPDRLYLTGSVWENAENLGRKVIAALEEAYPEGDPQRITLLEGKRGPTLTGQPVYGGKNGAFKRALHVSTAVKPNPFYPILVGYDFGEEKPAVVFAQFDRLLGAFRILLSIKGSYVVLEDLAPKVLEIQNREFPGYTIQSWCDPSGSKGNGGLGVTPVGLLRSLGVPAMCEGNANDAAVRYGAIQALSGLMRRTLADGVPAFQMHPRCIELSWNDQGELVERETQLMVTAFMTGYVWGESLPADTHPNIRKPKKGTRYDDLMNACEYVVIGERIGAPLAEHERASEKRRVEREGAKQAAVARAAAGERPASLAEAQWLISEFYRKNPRDHDEADKYCGKGKYGSRGGYVQIGAWGRSGNSGRAGY